MLFISHIFVFLFLPLTVLAYLVAGRRWGREATIGVLIAASVVFYGYWKAIYVPVLLGSVIFNYLAAQLIIRLTRTGASLRTRKIALAAGIGLDLALLGYFKYFNFFVDAADELLGTGWRIAPIVLPLAISFHTFQQISYLVDAYRGETGKYSFLQYTLFVIFFPQLIAGPIIKQGDTLPQIKEQPFYRFNHENLALGLSMFVLGFFKKVVIADYLARYANPAFHLAKDGLPVYFYEAWLSAMAYTLQLYFDFSGYSEMAIGLGRVFGVRLPLNFKSPLRATSIVDLWRCWHVTLYRFLRNYLYIPLGGNRKGWWRRAGNAMFTMLIGGIWHGAGWTYILFGGLHAIFLFLTLIWRSLLGVFGRRPEDSGPVWRWTTRALTFLAFVASCMIFRADNLTAVFVMGGAMLGLNGFMPPELTGADLAVFRVTNRLVFDNSGYLLVFALIAWCWLMPNVYQVMSDHQPGLDEVPAPEPPRLLGRLRWSPGWIWATALAVMAVLAALKANQPSPFIYFQF
jgi:alginate O-acetyltransferase complex protein AlgI